jgi:hypothetical protein
MDLLFGIGFVAAGALFFGIGLYLLVRSWQSRHWPRAIATIVSAGITEYYDRGVLMYRPATTFRYSVSGTEYVSDRRIYGGEMGLNMPEPAKALIAKYQPGMNVSVHYNPRNPAEGVLQPGQFLPAAIFLGMATAFLIIGYWSL